MNVCAKCGIPMYPEQLRCPHCGGLPVQTLPRGGGWQQAFTGVIGFGLLATALALVLGWVDLVLEEGEEAALAVALGLVAVPFAVSTFVPHGGLRRLLVGLGTGLAAAAVALGLALAWMVSTYYEEGVAPASAYVVLAIASTAGFCLGAYAGYRSSR